MGKTPIKQRFPSGEKAAFRLADATSTYAVSMYSWNLENERIEAEAYLCGRRLDFTTTYMRVANLRFVVEEQPEIVGAGTVNALQSVLEGTEHRRQRQVFFLFRKAAEALAAIVRLGGKNDASGHARKALTRILTTCTGPGFRAAAEAAGALPLDSHGAKAELSQTGPPAAVAVDHLSDLIGMHFDEARSEWKGRSLVIFGERPMEPFLVLKFSRTGQSPAELADEARWMLYLSKVSGEWNLGFDIPEPLTREGALLYRIAPSEIRLPEGLDIDPGRHAIAFRANPSYFFYPNHPRGGRMPAKDRCRSMLSRSARGFALLSAKGIVHTAPIPLFHNRIQQQRRTDGGLYEWRRGGRLDQWLASCRHPNIGEGGIRDFEHFIFFDGPSRRLYDLIGAQVLSLILVAGSYLRNHDASLRGLDAEGQPVDARHLFDRRWMKQTLEVVFFSFYEGFTGHRYTGPLPFNGERLSRRLIDEMGVDRHMEEVLRVAEQAAMSWDEFADFLTERGFDRETLSTMEKGAGDIRLLTGPHLGGFNQRISIPELIEYTAAVSALSILGRYCREG